MPTLLMDFYVKSLCSVNVCISHCDPLNPWFIAFGNFRGFVEMTKNKCIINIEVKRRSHFNTTTVECMLTNSPFEVISYHHISILFFKNKQYIIKDATMQPFISQRTYYKNMQKNIYFWGNSIFYHRGQRKQWSM